MPEGDTIYRAARTLQLALAGKSVIRSSEPRIVGDTVLRVESRGKNLLIHFGSGLTLHTHMRMFGSWHVYRPGEAWRKPSSSAKFVIETNDFVAVCFSAPVVRLLDDVKKDPQLKALGPDLLNPGGFSMDKILKRLRENPELELGVALMRQQTLAGIGNIYKSETLFLEKVSPQMKVADVPDSVLVRLVKRASALMGDNLKGGLRRTKLTRGDSTRYWVYRRKGERCLKCGTSISMIRQGPGQRSTYFCPVCQRVEP